MSGKTGVTKSNYSKKNRTDLFTRRVQITELLYQHNHASLIAKKLGLSKQLIRHDIAWLVKDKWIVPESNKLKRYKVYLITDHGKKIIEGVAKAQKKFYKRIENAQHKCKIQNLSNLKRFIKHANLTKQKFNNVETYHGYVRGYNLTVFIGKKDLPTLKIQPPVVTGHDFIEAQANLEQSLFGLTQYLNRMYSLNLTIPEPIHRKLTDEPMAEYCTNDEFSELVMQHTTGNQVKFQNVSIDRSKGISQIEITDTKKIEAYVNMPEQMKLLDKKIDAILNVTERLSDNMNRMVENMSSVFEKLNNNIEQITNPVIRINPMNTDSFRMFG